MSARLRISLRNVSYATILLGLAGCAVGPDFQKPEVALPATHRGAASEKSAAAIVHSGWWEIYRDPVLQALIRESLQKGFDVRIATARVEQARQYAVQTRSYYLPSFGVDGGASRGRNQAGGNPSYNRGATTDDAFAMLNAAWEIDVWGRLRRANESARAQYLSTEETARAVTLSLVAEVAQTYFQLLELDLELEIARKTTDSFSRSARIFGQRREGGVVSKLETSRADAALAQASATVPDLERQIILVENQLSILLGRPPGPITRSARLGQQILPPDIPAGLPADLIAQRPDLRASEQALRAANAEIGVSIAEYFPKIGLTAFFGRVSPDLNSFNNSIGNTWSVAGSVSGPVFQWGRVHAQVGAARARWEEARINHERAVYNALGEVAGALIAREKLMAVREQQAKAVQALTDAVEVSTQRYVNGKASYYEVLESQQELFPAENALARTELNQLLATVQLYKALGGGWQPEPPAVPSK
ncbi:MAG: efflux transporter outer membrane subunit [Nibricoccus sp.]